MKPRLPHSSRESTGAPSLRLAEAVSLQQEKQRFLFHSEPRCSRRLEGPPPSAVCRGMPAPPPPHPGCSLTLGASPVGSWDTVQALGPKLTRTPANCRCRGAGGPKPGAGSEHCGVARERGCSGRSPPGPGTGWLLRGTSPRPLPSTQHGHVQGACRAAGSIPGGRPATVGGAGPSGPPWRAEPLLSSQGLPEGLPSPLPPRARALAPTAPGGGPPTRADSDGGTRPVPVTWASADRRQGLASEKDRERGVCLPERGFPAASTARGPPAGRGAG